MSIDAPLSPNADRLRQIAAQYETARFHSFVIQFSVSFARTLFDKMHLQVLDPDALRTACLRATEPVADAVWDENVYAWVIDHEAITRNFVNREFASLPPADQDMLLFWLMNGAGRAKPYDFPRDFWFSAMIWTKRAGAFPDRAAALLQEMTSEQLGFAQDFSRAVQDALDDPAFHDAAALMCKQTPDATDLFQMTKFHIIYPDDDSEEPYDQYVSDPFLYLTGVREGNILRRLLAPIVARGNPFEWDALDKMVQVYAACEKQSEYTKAYADQVEAYALRNLYDWSRDA